LGIVECRVRPAELPIRIIAQMESQLAIKAHGLRMAVLEIKYLGLGFVSGHDDQ
jgi:hypothetical protein